MIQLFNVNRDEVIKSSVAQGETKYSFALESIYPLINKFDEQRKVQRRKFYERLEKDIIKGCLMPPITLAFVDEGAAGYNNLGQISTYVNANIAEGYVLDGMQRLTTLVSAAEKGGFDANRPLYLNVIIAERYDLLLYRMITLNNGQKPMTARHQIEMLTKGLIDTGGLGITVVSEKETEQGKFPGSFRRADVAAAYTAFLTDSVNNDNSRIIESKLDEILVGKVMDSNISESKVGFKDVLELVDRFSHNILARDWLRLGNNLIGFAVGAKVGFDDLQELSPDEFATLAGVFEEAFSGLNASKINVGKFRRELSRMLFEKISEFKDSDAEELLTAFVEVTMVD